MSKNYNIFKVLHFEEKETIHSAMIASIASYNQQSREAFFQTLKSKKVIKAETPAVNSEETFEKKIDCLIDPDSPDSIDFNSNINGHWIDTEVNLTESVIRNGKQISVNRGRADIWIGTNKDIEKPYRLIIENKINAGNQYHQLRRYYRYLTGDNRKFAGLFFLCPIYNNAFREQALSSAKKYNNESKVDGKERTVTEFAILTYKDDIIPWLNKVKENADDDDFLKVVDDYLELVNLLVDKALKKQNKKSKYTKTS